MTQKHIVFLAFLELKVPFSNFLKANLTLLRVTLV